MATRNSAVTTTWFCAFTSLKNATVDGSEILRLLRLVVFPITYKGLVLYIPGGYALPCCSPIKKKTGLTIVLLKVATGERTVGD